MRSCRGPVNRRARSIRGPVTHMKSLRRSTVEARARMAAPTSALKTSFVAAMALLAAALAIPKADASALATNASERVDSNNHYFRYSTALPGQRIAGGLNVTELSDQDFSSFSGVGMIVCTSNGVSRSSTAFLVGAFDIAVTVAHTFSATGVELPNCVYNSVDSLGQIRERIPVAYIKSQWAAEPGVTAEPNELSKDVAVVRLTQPSRYAQRTMPLGRFSGAAASVVMIGFKDAASSDTFKLKKRGRVYDETLGMQDSLQGAFTHDMDSRHVAPGAPVIDERTGVIIGIHTTIEQSKNTIITMNDWLEATIKGELQGARAN